MLVESANPAHSLADSQRMREALDVARAPRRHRRGHDRDRAARRLRAARAVAVREVGGDVLQLRVPRNVFHLRRPLLEPLPGHAGRARDPRPPVRGARRVRPTTTSRRCAPPPSEGRAAFADAFFAAMAAKPELGRPGAGRALPHARPDAARRCRGGGRAVGRRPPLRAGATPTSVAPRRLHGEGLEPGEQLFDAILASPSGVVFTVDEPDETWRRLAHRRRPRAPRHPRSCSTSSTRSPPSAAAGRIGRVPVRALRRRAAVVHRQHDLPRPGVAEEGRAPARCASAPPTPTALGVGRRRRRAGHHQARQRPSPSVEVDDMHAAGPRLAAERPRPRLPGRGRRDGRHRRGAERAHLERGPRPARRHAVAQARAGPARAGRAPPDHATHPLRRLAVPDRPDHRPDRRLVDAARAARAVQRPVAASTISRRRSAAAGRCWPSGSTGWSRRGCSSKVAVRGAPAALRVPVHRQGPRVLGRPGRDVALGLRLAVGGGRGAAGRPGRPRGPADEVRPARRRRAHRAPPRRPPPAVAANRRAGVHRYT